MAAHPDLRVELSEPERLADSCTRHASAVRRAGVCVEAVASHPAVRRARRLGVSTAVLDGAVAKLLDPGRGFYAHAARCEADARGLHRATECFRHADSEAARRLRALTHRHHASRTRHHTGVHGAGVHGGSEYGGSEYGVGGPGVGGYGVATGRRPPHDVGYSAHPGHPAPVRPQARAPVHDVGRARGDAEAHDGVGGEALRERVQARLGGRPEPGGPIGRWIAAAIEILAAHGVPVSEMDPEDIALIVRHESGGDPQARNLWDSNAAAGAPSEGLMQTTGPTFAAYRLPGHGDILDPVDNLVAGIRYAVDRYGSVSRVPGVVRVKEGRDYVGF